MCLLFIAGFSIESDQLSGLLAALTLVALGLFVLRQLCPPIISIISGCSGSLPCVHYSRTRDGEPPIQALSGKTGEAKVADGILRGEGKIEV